MIDIISTTKNKTYKYIKALQQKKTRMRERRFTVEGIKSVREAAASAMRIAITAVSESFYGNENFDYPAEAGLFVVKDELFAGLCDTKTPQGIIAVIDMPSHSDFSAIAGKPYIYCDNVSDPGNLGTIIRTADAAGFGAVLLSPGCADLYSPKTVRSSMGSFFNIDVVPDFEMPRLFEMKKQGFELYCGALRKDSMNYTSADFKKPSVIIVGNEANGVCDEILAECRHIIIPIQGCAESLNAAVAAAVMMYELVRQRSIQG